MTDAQTWTLIVGVLTTFVAIIGLVSTVFIRVIRAEIGGLRSEMGGLRSEMVVRFTAVNERLDYLDRDVQALMKRVFHRPE
ncbi:hypothetical protein [Aeromicrobium piscarium]|uniref:Uncharacterized protein n=1 Tax=Aeromicrobium piscarium TaxID=2590901 RepID=A0A554RI49_9ACTN|nr:hypothetical protein [Aeromicrobium piscarium]TSD53682.1 hypothetical protein FNM00_18105 [Aeromicrobium piscarium]